MFYCHEDIIRFWKHQSSFSYNTTGRGRENIKFKISSSSRIRIRFSANSKLFEWGFVHMRWASPVRWAGAPMWENFRPIFISEILSQSPGPTVIASVIFRDFFYFFLSSLMAFCTSMFQASLLQVMFPFFFSWLLHSQWQWRLGQINWTNER